MQTLRRSADEIIQRHPEHSTEVEKEMGELSAMHIDLLRQARLQIDATEQSQGQQMFNKASRSSLIKNVLV